MGKQFADKIIYNSKAFLADRSGGFAEALAIKDGKIIFVGNDSEAKTFAGKDTVMIDAGGNTVLPGLFDNHCHPCNYIFKVGGVELYKYTTLKEMQKEIKAYADNHKDKFLIRGSGWNFSDFIEESPRKEFLDEIVPDRPVVLYSGDYHNTWVNSKALQIAGINRDTKDPEGGHIERDETGEATGLLTEIACMLMIDDCLGPYTPSDFKIGIEQFFEDCASVGITSVREAAISDEPAYESYHMIAEEGLDLNVFIDVLIDNKTIEPAEKKVKDALEVMESLQKDGYHTGGVKIFMDGVCEAMTGGIEEPYLGTDGNRGSIIWDQNDYNEICRICDVLGLQVHVHAIGDRAVRYTVNGMEYAREMNGGHDSRNMIAHIQLLNDFDLKRIKALNIIPVMTPQWFEKGDMYSNIELRTLGRERADSEYVFDGFFKNGIMVTCGSDAPAGISEEILPVSFSPWVGIQQAVTRCTPGLDGNDLRNVHNPAERTTLENAIRSYTINCAYSWFLERETGSLETGKQADIIILDRDLFETDINEIYRTNVLLTMVKGKTVYDAM